MLKRLSIAAGLAAALLVPAALAAPAQAQTAQAPGFVTVQPAGQWLASLFMGQPVTNAAGERIGDINDLLLDKSGRVETVVIGVGGFLGMGEKNVAVPFGSMSITADPSGQRVVQITASKQQLEAAPAFKATEKTVYMRAKERAGEIGQQAIDKAGELKDQAAKKIEEMRANDAPKNNEGPKN